MIGSNDFHFNPGVTHSTALARAYPAGVIIIRRQDDIATLTPAPLFSSRLVDTTPLRYLIRTTGTKGAARLYDIVNGPKFHG